MRTALGGRRGGAGSISPVLQFDITAEELAIGRRRLVVWRPSFPQEVEDPEAERLTAGPVWAQTWTSGVVLATLVAKLEVRGARVLELGCGLGLVGLAAAAAGAEVTVSDRSRYALAFAAANAEHNDLHVDTVRCDWSNPAALVARAPWDLVLGSDVLYDERSAWHLLALLERVVAPSGEAWITDPGRDPARALLAGASPTWQVSRRPCGHGVHLYRLAPDLGP